MLIQILFYTVSLALLVAITVKTINKRDLLYFISIVMQIVGIILKLICLIFKIKKCIPIEIISFIFSIVIPIAILWCEYKKINLSEKVYILMAKICLIKKDNKNAKKILLSFIDNNEHSKLCHKLLAKIYESEGGRRKAIDEYVKVVDLDNKEYESYYKIALLLKEMGNKEDSQSMLIQLINKKPDYLEASITLSEILCDKESYKEALNLMQNIIKYYPNNFDILYNMGMIYTLLNDFTNAKMCYEKAAIINSLSYNSNYNIAMIELIIGELESSEKYFNICIENEELSALAYYNLAKIYLLKSDKDLAIKTLNLAIELDNSFYKKAIEEEIFNPIKAYIYFPNIDDEDIEIKKYNSSERELLVRNHLENTYKLVGKLNYKEMGIKYNNITKDDREEQYKEK